MAKKKVTLHPVVGHVNRGGGVGGDNVFGLVLAGGLRSQLAYCASTGWLVWNGTRWRPDGSGAPAAHKILGDYLRQPTADLLTGQRGAVQATGPTALQVSKLLSFSYHQRLLTFLRGHLEVAVEELDADPHLLNTPSGIVNLETGELGPSDPARLMTHETAVAYRPGAVHSDWERALEAMPDAASLRWLQGALGSGCWGVQRGDFLALLTGGGANGKSTITGAAISALGSYAGPVARGIITGGAGGAEVAALRGMRLALVEETADGNRLDMSEVKRLLGTEQIAANPKYKDPFVFDAAFSLFVTTNHRPMVPDTDHGTWRRLLRLEFSVRYEGDGLDPTLRRRVQRQIAQQEAVLAWLVEGALWDVPEPSERMSADLAEWRAESDPIATFIGQRLWLSLDGFTPRAEIYEAFSDYLVSEGAQPWGARKFWQRWREHPLVESVSQKIEEAKPHTGPRGISGIVLHPFEFESSSSDPWVGPEG